MAASLSARLFFVSAARSPALVARAAQFGGFQTLDCEERAIDLLDARAARPDLTLDTAGFAHRPWRGLDPAQLSQSLDEGDNTPLYADVRKLVREATGADEVLVLGHRRRIRAQTEVAIQPDLPPRAALGAPSVFVHVDYSPSYARHLLGLYDVSDATAFARQQIINVWKPTNGTIRAWPLALCDASSIAPADLIVAGAGHAYEDRPLQSLGVSWSADQRWYAMRDQTPDEVTLIKQYDSAAEQAGVAPFAVHGCAYDRPHLPGQGGAERLTYPQSVELRVIALHRRRA